MNKVEIMGRLTRDVEVKETKNKKQIFTFTLAVPRKLDDKVDFIDCLAFSNIGEIIKKYTEKGRRIIVCGSLNINSYEDKLGNTKHAPVIIVDDFYFADYSAKENKGEQQELPY